MEKVNTVPEAVKKMVRTYLEWLSTKATPHEQIKNKMHFTLGNGVVVETSDRFERTIIVSRNGGTGFCIDVASYASYSINNVRMTAVDYAMLVIFGRGGDV